MLISEIFVSLAGEGPDAGVPMVFIRFQKCNLACPYCDSKYTWSNSGQELSIGEILAQVRRANPNHIFLTGGEPLFQPEELQNLVKELREAGHIITIATNGTLPRPSWWNQVKWDVDCKCPSSGTNEFDWSWSTIGRKNRLKFVVADKNDLQFVIDMLPKLDNLLCPTLLVSPVIMPATLQNKSWLREVWNFCIKHNLRYSHQIHKVVWGLKRGV